MTRRIAAVITTPHRPRRSLLGAVALALCAHGAGCADDGALTPTAAVGDAHRGKSLALTYGCQTCHVIPGVAGANATVGPPLGGLGERTYAGGRLNTPENLREFIKNPPAVDPRTPMPAVGVTDDDARDLVAYLYTLTDR